VLGWCGRKRLLKTEPAASVQGCFWRLAVESRKGVASICDRVKGGPRPGGQRQVRGHEVRRTQHHLRAHALDFPQRPRRRRAAADGGAGRDRDLRRLWPALEIVAERQAPRSAAGCAHHIS